VTLTATDFGAVADLATALGILRDGSPDPGWFGDPAARLGAVLSDDAQRDALVGFLDSVLDDDTVHQDDGRVVLPVVQADDPRTTVAVVLEPLPDVVRVGVRAELTAAAVSGAQSRPEVTASIEAALFQVCRGSAPPVDPLVLGRPGGRIRLAAELSLDGAAVPGGFHLGGVAVDVDVPTATGDDPPVLALRLSGLQLPNAAPRDIVLDAASVATLGEDVVDLVVGLVQAQAASAGGPLADLATLVGLAGAVPSLPLAALRSQGVDALVTWFSGVFGDATAQAAWLNALASLLPVATVARGGVEAHFGSASVRLEMRSFAGPTGQLRLTPAVDVSLGDSGRLVQGHLELFTLDVATGGVTGVPQLSVWGYLGRTPGGAEPVILDAQATAATPAVRVEAVRAGFALDTARRPTFVLAADRVDIGGHTYPTLDLTSTDVLMDAAGSLADSVLDHLLDGLGDVADTVRTLLGLAPPPGHAGVPTVTLADVLRDPLGAVAGYWHTVLTSHADAVPDLLGVVRTVLASAGSVTLPVEGDGTADTPWRVPLTAAFELQAFRTGDELHVSAATVARIDALSQQCIVIDSTLAVELASVDLAARHVHVLGGAVAKVLFSGSGVVRDKALLNLGPIILEADHVLISFDWRASDGVAATFAAPGLALVVDDDRVPLMLPTPGAVLDELAWDGVERLISLVAPAAPPALSTILDLLGWSPGSGPRLRLADLVGPTADAPSAIGRWLSELALAAGPAVVAFIADLITGTDAVGGLVSGAGTPSRPFALPLDPGAHAPELLLWFPGAADSDGFVSPGDEVTTWRPGDTGLASELLARGLADEAVIDDAVADLVWNRPLAAGIEALVARWTGTDGRIVPPAAAPDGVDVVVIEDAAAAQLAGQIDLTELLDHEPPVVVHVRVATDAGTAFPDAPPDRVVDLTAANRAPESFAAPVLAAGEWFVAVGPRSVAALAGGDPDGSLGQAARLGLVLTAAAGLGAGQVVIGEGGAGHAARIAAVDAPAVSDVLTLGTPLGPVAFSVLDEAAAGDAWRLLDTLTTGIDAGDEDLARGRALVDALAEVDVLADPGAELRPPAGGVPSRAGLAVHAVFGAAGEPAVRRAVTALVATGLVGHAINRIGDGAAASPTAGIRVALRTPVAADDDDPLVVSGAVVTDLAGWDVTDTGIASSAELAVRVSLRVGMRSGWLAGGPDPQRGPAHPRQHAVRALAAEVVVPRGAASTAVGQGSVTILDGRAFDQARERWELVPGGEPVGAEARLLLSLATARVSAEAAAATPSASAAALRTVLEASTLVAGDGSVADAIEQLINDPGRLAAAVLGDDGRRDQLVAGARALLAATPTGPAAEIRFAVGAVTVVADLAARTLTVDAPDAGGKFGWAAHMAVAPGDLDWWLRVGRPGPAHSVAGAAWLTADPHAVVLHRQTSGGAKAAAQLWPTFDAAKMADAVGQLAPALFAGAALELMRDAEDAVRPLVDAALSAVGLLDATGALRLPLGLLTDPVGWLRHPDVLGADPGRLIALVESLKPLLGVAGGPGELAIAPGVTLAARNAAGAFELHASVDTGAFDTPATRPLGRLVGGLDAGVRVSAGAKPQATLDLFAGPASQTPGRRAVHVAVTDQLSVFVRPTSGADVALYPNGPGLGALAGQAVTAAAHALPFALDQLAAQTGNDLAGDVAKLVAAAGDALGLRDATHHFDYDRLVAFAANPAAALVTAASTTVIAELTHLVDGFAAALPPAVSVARDGQALRLTVGVVTLRWTPSPFQARSRPRPTVSR
jgi:hypothetical protein